MLVSPRDGLGLDMQSSLMISCLHSSHHVQKQKQPRRCLGKLLRQPAMEDMEGTQRKMQSERLLWNSLLSSAAFQTYQPAYAHKLLPL